MRLWPGARKSRRKNESKFYAPLSKRKRSRQGRSRDGTYRHNRRENACAPKRTGVRARKSSRQMTAATRKANRR